MAGGGIARGAVYGKSDKTGSSPAENPVHPIELLATVYHAMGIDPATMVNNLWASRGNWCRPSRW